MELCDVFESVNNAHISGKIVPFDSKRLTSNQSNMKTSQVTEIFQRVGIDMIWRRLSSMQDIVDCFPTALPKQIESKLIEDWNAVFSERDIIMHNNSSSNGIGAIAISNYARFFKICLSSMIELLNSGASEILS